MSDDGILQTSTLFLFSHVRAGTVEEVEQPPSSIRKSNMEGGTAAWTEEDKLGLRNNKGHKERQRALMKTQQEQGKKESSSSSTGANSNSNNSKSTSKQTKMPTPQEMQELYDKITPLQKIVTLQHIYSLYMAAAQQSEKKEVSFNIIQLQRMINSNPLVNPDFDFLDISGFLNSNKDKPGRSGSYSSGSGSGTSSVNSSKGPVSPVQLIQILTESLTLRDERGRNEQVIQQVPNTMLFRLSKFIDLNFVKDRLIKLLNAYKNTTLKEIEDLENKWKTKKSEIQKIEEGKMDDGVLYEEFLKDLKRKRGAVDKKSVVEVKKEGGSKSISPAPEKSGGDLQGKKLQISRHVSKQIVEKSLEMAEESSNQAAASSNTASPVVSGERAPEGVMAKEQPKTDGDSSPDTVESAEEPLGVTGRSETATTPKAKKDVSQVREGSEKEDDKEVFVDAAENVSPKEKPVELKKTAVGVTAHHTRSSSKHKLDDGDGVEEESRTSKRAKVDAGDSEQQQQRAAKTEPVVEGDAADDEKDTAAVQTRAKTRSMTSHSKERPAPPTKAESKKFQQLSVQLIMHISSHRIASMFLNPVNAHDEPQYYELIKRPVDLKTIVKRIKAGEIATLERLELEMQIMFTNAIMYNDMGQEDVYRGILDMKKEWAGLVSMLRENM